MTNINRQVHALTSTVGESKVEAMAKRITDINPECEVAIIDDFLSLENVREYIKEFDYTIDCIDQVKVKAALIAHCKQISTDNDCWERGQIDRVRYKWDVAKTKHDPLLAKVRYILRKQYNFSNNPKRKFGVDCIYSEEQLVYPSLDGNMS